jgi:trans-2,3-dihydro-3-hydroxyanthranilate isomerase
MGYQLPQGIFVLNILFQLLAPGNIPVASTKTQEFSPGIPNLVFKFGGGFGKNGILPDLPDPRMILPLQRERFRHLRSRGDTQAEAPIQGHTITWNSPLDCMRFSNKTYSLEKAFTLSTQKCAIITENRPSSLQRIFLYLISHIKEAYSMQSFRLLQVDAFTHVPLGGNPCAVVMEADSLSEKEMLMIAKEMNLSETAFTVSSETADFGARYFTPAGEIPFAGHPTVATVIALEAEGFLELPPGAGSREVSLELPVGNIPVLLERAEKGNLRVTMTQNAPEFLRTYRPEDILPCFSLSKEDLLEDLPLQTVSTGTPQLMIPLRGHRALRLASPNLPMLAKLVKEGDFSSIHLFCLGGMTPRGATAARHFSAPPEVLEDPFTGSATGSMGAYLWHYELLKEPAFLAEQGHWLYRPGEAAVEVLGDRKDIRGIKVGGGGVTVFRGELSI